MPTAHNGKEHIKRHMRYSAYGVHIVTARVVAEPPKAARCIGVLQTNVVTSTIRSDCYRLERQLPGGVRTR